MDEAEALSAGAQVAITLAGFTGVVAAFGERGVRAWSELDKFRLRLMLTTSAYPTVLCLLGLLFTNTTLEPPWAWRICSLLAVLLMAMSVLLSRSWFRRFVTGEMKATLGTRLTFWSSAFAGSACMALLLLNIVRLAAFWPFYTVIVTAIMLSMVQFIRLILVH